MIGTLYERLRACLDVLHELGIARQRMAVRGHPVAIRALAVAFAGDVAKSKAEIEFTDDGGIVWLGSRIWQDDTLRESNAEQTPFSVVWIEIDRRQAIAVEPNELPELVAD
jgi:hypothetical protein